VILCVAMILQMIKNLNKLTKKYSLNEFVFIFVRNSCHKP
jgi:hypothetical protein